METKAMRFIRLAKRLVPHYEELQSVSTLTDSYDEIDELMFRRSEYLGGVAAVLISLLKLEDK